MYKVKSRPFTLLEVLIAFLIIVTAAIPLVAPYPVMFKKQKKFIEELEIDRLANLYFVDLLAKILRKEIAPTDGTQGVLGVPYLINDGKVTFYFPPDYKFTYSLARYDEK